MIFLVAIGLSCLGVWILGDFRLIEFPTLLNGRLAYPPSQAIPQIRLIYGSRLALMLYAWLSPIVEAAVLYFFVYFIVNGKNLISGAKAVE
jgi:hypothetical protein